MEIRYRPDIDGLRAVAVLLVIVYHVGSQFITGGFIGVDIFFVISGYLITSIIRKEISNGSFTYSGFYNRRIKRILPSLLVVLFTTLVASIFILMPDEFIYMIKSAIFTLLSISNFLFYFNTTSYFSGNADQIPLLHTWSLSVEEQYYLIAPLIISFVILKFRKYELQIFVLIIIALFAVSQYGALIYTSLAYYMLPFRAFELMIGGVISILLSNYKFESTKVSNAFSILGITLIAFSSFSIEKESLFPGYNALIPCVGAALIIIAGANQSFTPIVNRVLSLKPVVFIGKISYSMYLWHWPIIALLNYRGVEFTIFVKFVVLILTIALSILNFYAFETKMRKLKMGFLTSLLLLLILPLVIFSFISLWASSEKGFPDRFNNNDFANENRSEVKYSQCYDSYSLTKDGLCIIGDVTKKPETIMIGDSIAGSYIEFIDYLAKDAGKSVAVTVSSSLPPIMNINPYRDGTKVSKYRSEEKLSYNKKRIDLARGYKNVIVGASWGNDDSYFKADGYDILSTLEYLSSHGAKLIVILRPNGMDYKEFNKFKSDIASGNDDHSELAKKVNVNISLDEIMNSYKEPVYIDPNDSLCTDSGCKVYLNGRFIYMDHAHLNVYGARELARIYLKNHKNPLL